MDDGLENKFRLSTIAPLDRRMKRKHLAVYGFLLDWYHRKYGDALASVRHIVAQLKERDPAGIGLYTGDVHSALKDLEAWGYITADVGRGRKASRYVPVWAHGRSVHKIPNTTGDAHSVRETPNTSVRETPNTTGDSVRGNQNKDPSTLIRSQDQDTGKDGYDCAPASPPLPVGLMATGAGGAQGGFDEVWQAYFPQRGRGDKKKARAAYDKLSPDADLQKRIVASAADWHAAWAAQGDDSASRKHLDTWIAGEHYDCDPPGPYKAKDRKAGLPGSGRTPANHRGIASVPDNDNIPDIGIPISGADMGNPITEDADEIDWPEWAKGTPRTWPVGDLVGEFSDAVPLANCGDEFIDFNFVVSAPPALAGRSFLHRVCWQASTKTAQDEGQRSVTAILEAVGISDLKDTDDLLFKPLRVRSTGSKLIYSSMEDAA